jgi:tRNA A37 threonylcarbamoyladenosine synthetase subunit TsaC/SUA5/YrdC
MEEYAHVVWANRIERCTAAIPDTDGLWISKIRKAMLKVLQKVTEPTHTDWALFCKATRTVTLTQINEAKEEEQEACISC